MFTIFIFDFFEFFLEFFFFNVQLIDFLQKFFSLITQGVLDIHYISCCQLGRLLHVSGILIGFVQICKGQSLFVQFYVLLATVAVVKRPFGSLLDRLAHPLDSLFDSAQTDKDITFIVDAICVGGVQFQKLVVVAQSIFVLFEALLATRHSEIRVGIFRIRLGCLLVGLKGLFWL